MGKKLYESNNIKAIADAIRDKNHTDNTYKVSEMANAINDITLSGMYVKPRTSWKVVFVDIDGTVLWEGYVEDGEELPFEEAEAKLQPHEHLTFIKWNQTDRIANHENYYDDNFYKTIVIGPEYDLTKNEDGEYPDTTIKLQVNHKLNLAYGIRIQPTVKDGVQINWGDGTVTTTTSTSLTNYNHTYTTSGLYYITITATNGTYLLKGSSSSALGFTNFTHGMKEMIVGKGCTSVGTYCFYNLYSLKKLCLSNLITSFGNYAIYDCYSLQYINIPSSVTTLAYTSFCAYNYSFLAIVIPDGVKSIAGSGSISYCYGVNYISIPKSCTNFASSCLWALYPIYVSSRLKQYENSNYCWLWYTYPETIYDNEQPIVTTRVGRSNPYLCNVNIPNGNSLYTYSFAYCSNLRNINISDTTTTIPAGAFNNCRNLLKLELPSSVKTLNESSFAGCWMLREIDMSNITTTSPSVFYDCRSLERFTWPNITTLYANSVRGMYSLRNFTYPETVTTLSSTYIFYQDYMLEEIIEPDTITSATGTYRYGYCYSMKYAKYSAGLDYIPNYTFYCCNSLQVLDFGNTRTTVPRFGTSATSTTVGTTYYINTTSLLFIIVPDALYDEWIASPYWSSFTQYIIKHSDYYSMFTDNDR